MAVINIVKSASTLNATVGDTFSYQFQISNTGNTAAVATLTDNIPTGSVFIENSVLINGNPVPGVSPVTGIPLGSVDPGNAVTVSFVVTVTSMPASRQLTDQAATSFSYILPGGRQVGGSAASNTVTIPVALPNVSVVKTASMANVVVGDILTFTSTVTNNGTSNVNNVSLLDNVPSNASFIPQSVIVNGTSDPSAVPSEGISIGTLTPGSVATVTFEVRITMPIPSQINNQSTVSFTSGTFSGTTSSNMTTTPVIQPQIAVTKSANTSNATVGDSVTYTVTVSNSGNLGATVTLTDTIPASTTFSPNSVIVNGFPIPGASSAAGIDLGTLAPGASSVVTFVVVVDSLPNPQTISNQATATFTYSPPDGRTLTDTALSNTVTIPVSAPNVVVVKSTPTTATTVGDTISYTVTVNNSGIETVNNVQLTDIIPVGATFVAGSVSIDGTPVPGANPANGIALGPIGPGATVTVVFSITVDSIPASGSIDNMATVTFTSGAFSGLTNSNTVSTPAFNPVPDVTKSANTSNATVGDTVTYTFVISNSGNFPEQVTLTDNIPVGTSLVPNSVLVNGIPQPGADPTAGISASVINPGQTTTAVFSVVINTLPSPQQIVNQGSAAAAFTLPDGRTFIRTAASNTLTIPVSAPNVSVVKSTPATALTVGDAVRYQQWYCRGQQCAVHRCDTCRIGSGPRIGDHRRRYKTGCQSSYTYTVAITNTGNIPAQATLTDPVPAGAVFVPNSIQINDVPQPGADPNNGFSVGTVNPGQTISVTVTMQIVVETLPNPQQLVNQATVDFTFTRPDGEVITGLSASNTLVIPVSSPDVSVVKSTPAIDAVVGDVITYTIAVTNNGIAQVNDVLLVDPVPTGSAFVPGSVTVDGVPRPAADPNTGITVGSIPADDTIIVTFQVQVTTV